MKDHATRAIRFIENLTVEVDGDIVPFVLRPWQREIIATLFGTIRPDNLRAYKKLFLALPRGQGKTALIAAMALYCLCSQGKGQRIYSASGDKEQAALIFDACVGYIRRDTYLSSIIEIYTGKKKLVYTSGDCTYQALSSDSDHPHGLRPSVCLFDEVHVFPNRRLHDALTTGMGKRSERLTVYITTAGYDKQSFCYELWQYALKVRDQPEIDPTFLPYVYAADPEIDDWQSEDTWHKACPALGDFYSLEFMRDEYKDAKAFPYKENVFKNWYLNIWTEQETRWLSVEQWDNLKRQYSPAELWGRNVYLALDLSSNTDLTALALLFPMDDGTYHCIPRFFMPRETSALRSLRDHVDYNLWIASGDMIPTEGNVTDYDAIKAEIDSLRSQYNIQCIAIDPWNAQQLCNALDADGYKVWEYRNNHYNLSAPCKELERMVLGGQISHDGNPCLRWNLANVAVDTDATGKIRPSKVKSSERIDGVVAAIMALGVALRDRPPEMPGAMIFDLN